MSYRPSALQACLLVVACAAALVLVVGVAHTLVTGDTWVWLIAVAALLVASLTGLTSLRRK